MSIKTGRISLGDGETVVLGQYDKRVRWNGWLCPVIDSHAVATVLEFFTNPDDLDAIQSWDFAETSPGVFVLSVYESADKYGPFGAEPTGELVADTYDPDSDGLYPLGAFGWCWYALGDSDCSECGDPVETGDVHAGHGMCGGCLHDAVRSGWEPQGGDESD